MPSQEAAKDFVATVQGVSVEPVTKFWRAEGYHQEYWPKWKKRVPFFVLLLLGTSNPGEALPPWAQTVCNYAYLLGLVLAVVERKIDNEVKEL